MSLSARTASGTSPSRRRAFRQSTASSVREATYFGVALRCAAIGFSSGWVGQYATNFSYVRRPNR